MDTTSSNSKMNRMLKKLFGIIDDEVRQSKQRSFEQIRTDEQAFESIDRGTMSVSIDRISGSVGRYHEFDAHFKPKGYDSEDRLSAIKKAMKDGRPIPPISLYQIKDKFYILDGHHRYSAAKEIGFKDIRAHVLELIPSKDTFENRLYRERSEFRDVFRLAQPIELTEIGQYAVLEEQIAEHRVFLEKESGGQITELEAAADWYQTIYMPLKHLIESSGIADSFEKRTVDDLYLYISLHQWKMGKSRQYGIGIDKLIPKNMEEFRKKMAEHTDQNYPEMRREISVFILMNVEGRHEDRIMEKLIALEAVKEVHSVHGAIDIIIKVKLTRDLLSSDAELISQFLQSSIRLWPGVVSTQTLLPGISHVKD